MRLGHQWLCMDAATQGYLDYRDALTYLYIKLYPPLHLSVGLDLQAWVLLV